MQHGGHTVDMAITTDTQPDAQHSTHTGQRTPINGTHVLNRSTSLIADRRWSTGACIVPTTRIHVNDKQENYKHCTHKSSSNTANGHSIQTDKVCPYQQCGADVLASLEHSDNALYTCHSHQRMSILQVISGAPREGFSIPSTSFR